MRLERTKDASAVQAIIGHPGVKEHTWDRDDEPPVYLADSIYYLMAKGERHADGAIEDVTLGVVAFIPVNPITWNPHIAILPEHRGTGTEAMTLAGEWMFQNTPCRKLVAYPPVFNKRVIRVFEKCGFRREGFSPKSFPWRGQIYDRVLMGKEAVCGPR